MKRFSVDHSPVPVSLLFALFLFALCIPLELQAQDFTIASFHADIVIDKDSSFTVKETITVDFHRPRHGIYRDIPFRYKNELGRTHLTPLTVLSVLDGSGNKWKTKLETQGNTLRIRIGDADRYVSGRQIYVISYHVENAILFFDDHDELYWNITGNYWQAPIQEASASVILSAETKSKTLRTACYTGVLGSRDSDCRFETFGNSADFSAKRGLRAGEGLTVAFGWDKGIVQPMSEWKKIVYTTKENWSFILPIFSLLFMTNLWLTRGRDPKVREAVTVRYEPPRFNDRPISPGEVGALVDETIDQRDITSTIVGLAVKGYVQIEEVKKEGWIFDSVDYYLKRLKQQDGNLGRFETELMKSLFGDTLPGILVSEMKNRFYRHLDSLKKALYGELVDKKYFLKSPEKIRIFYGLIALLITVAAVALSVLLTRALFSAAPPDSAVLKSIGAGLVTGVPVLIFSRIMPAKTRAGASAYMEILGFEEFMTRTEGDRLKRMDDKDLFSRFLPYAMALDIADNWAKAFEGIYQNPPEWYKGSGELRTFSPHGFSRSLNSMTSSLGSAIYSTPRGSGTGGGGSGGGGSSGGGFGGGGGGSW